MQIATAYVTLRVDTRDARKQAVEETKKIGSEMNSALAEAFSAVAFTKAVSGMIREASRLEQSVGATSSVFKESATVIDSFARTSATSFGISSAAARELTAQTGALLKGFGFTTQAAAEQSVAMAKLGADLSAAFGGRPEEAVQALGAALRGEFNPAERFGVSLTAASVAARAVEMGLADTVTAVDATAKAQAALAIITEQTADVQGQFAREAGTAAGAAAIATAKFDDQRAKLGEDLLPIYSQAITLLSGMVGVFTEMPGPMQTVVIALAGMAAMAGPVGRVVDVSKQLGGAFRNASPAATALGSGLGLAAIAAAGFAAEAARSAQNTSNLTSALAALGKQADERILDDMARVLHAAAANGDDTTVMLTELGEANRGTLMRVRELLAATQEQEVTHRGYTLTLEDVDAALAEAARRTAQLASDTEAATPKIDDATKSVDFLGEAARGAGEKFAAANVSASDLASQVGEIDVMFSDAAETVGIFQRALESVMGAEVSLEESNRAIREEIDALNLSLFENGATLDINSEKGRKNREQVQANVEAILDHAEALVGSGASAKEAGEAVDGLREMLIGQLEAADLSREAAEDYIKTLGLTPENVDTAIRLTKQEKAKADIEAILKEIPGYVPTEIQALIDEGKYAEALRRLKALEDPLSVTVNVSYSGVMDGGVYDSGGGYGRPEGDDEDKAGRGPAAGSIPVIGSTSWWQSLMGTGSGSTPSGPSPERKAFDAEFQKAQRRYSLGDLTPAEYLAELRRMRRRYQWPRLSDPGYALQQEIDRVQEDVREAQDALVKDVGSPVDVAFEQAAADQAAIEARQARRDARREAIETAMDPESSAADRKRAEEAWAQAILNDLDAQANRKGMADRTVPWAKYVRRGLEKAARDTPALRDEIGVLLAGIPNFASDSGGGGGPAGDGPAASQPGGGGGSGNSNRMAGGDVSPTQAGGGAVIVQTFGTEPQWVEQLARRIAQIQRGNS